MDVGAPPPEINSGRTYTGPGPAAEHTLEWYTSRPRNSRSSARSIAPLTVAYCPADDEVVGIQARGLVQFSCDRRLACRAGGVAPGVANCVGRCGR
jgi:hypothetical protein